MGEVLLYIIYVVSGWLCGWGCKEAYGNGVFISVWIS